MPVPLVSAVGTILLMAGLWSGWRTWRRGEGWPLGSLLLGAALGWWFVKLEVAPDAAATVVGFPLAAAVMGPGRGAELAQVSLLGTLGDLAAGLCLAALLGHGAWRCRSRWRGLRRRRYRLVYRAPMLLPAQRRSSQARTTRSAMFCSAFFM